MKYVRGRDARHGVLGVRVAENGRRQDTKDTQFHNIIINYYTNHGCLL